MQQNNPYGFHLDPEASQAQPAGTSHVSQSAAQYNLNGAEYYQSPYQQADPFAGVVDLTARKKKCLTISLAIMCGGLVISTISAFVTYIVLMLFPEMFSVVWIGSLIFELVMVFATSHCITKNKAGLGIVCYILYAIANGTTFLSIFINYAPASILSLFLVTAVIFGGTTLVSLAIPKDMSRWSLSLTMGLFALLAMMLLNMFFRLPAFDTFICIFGIVLFVAITAYDVKKVNALAMEDTASSVWTVGLFGGMNFYLDFVNLLLRILRLFGRKSN